MSDFNWNDPTIENDVSIERELIELIVLNLSQVWSWRVDIRLKFTRWRPRTATSWRWSGSRTEKRKRARSKVPNRWFICSTEWLPPLVCGWWIRRINHWLSCWRIADTMCGWPTREGQPDPGSTRRWIPIGSTTGSSRKMAASDQSLICWSALFLLQVGWDGQWYFGHYQLHIGEDGAGEAVLRWPLPRLSSLLYRHDKRTRVEW